MRRILARTWFFASCWLMGLSLLHCGGEEPTQRQWCEDTSNEAGLRSYAAISSAGRACSADTDCVLFRNPLTCVSGCGDVTPMASAAVPQLDREVQALNEEYCAPFEEKQCPGPIALPCVAPEGREVPACAEGRCTFIVIPWDELTE